MITRSPKIRKNPKVKRDLRRSSKRGQRSDLDMKKRWENFKDFTPVLAIILCFVVAGLTAGIIVLGVQTNNITNYTFGDDDYRNYTYYDEHSGITFTDTIYVSDNGDNTTGGNWKTAFNEISYALSVASTDPDNITLIMLDIGEHDVDMTGNPTFSANLYLRGLSTESTLITNTHASATSILKFMCNVFIEDLQFKLGSDIDGVLFYDSTTRIENVWFNGSLLEESHTIAYFYNTVFDIQNSEFLGESTATYSIGAVFENCDYGQTINNRVCFNYIGWEFIQTSYAQLKDTCFVHDYTAIQTDENCTNLYWFDLHFSYNNYMINDTSQNSYYDQYSMTIESEVSYLYPRDTTAGLELKGHINANAYGGWFNFTHNEDRWYKLIGTVVTSPSDASAFYRVQIAIQTPDNHDDPIVVGEIFFAGSAGYLSISNVFMSGVLCPDTVVRARIMTSDGGSDTIRIFGRITDV